MLMSQLCKMKQGADSHSQPLTTPLASHHPLNLQTHWNGAQKKKCYKVLATSMIVLLLTRCPRGADGSVSSCWTWRPSAASSNAPSAGHRRTMKDTSRVIVPPDGSGAGNSLPPTADWGCCRAARLWPRTRPGWVDVAAGRGWRGHGGVSARRPAPSSGQLPVPAARFRSAQSSAHSQRKLEQQGVRMSDRSCGFLSI